MEKSETTFIYGLNDPETGLCRYLGKSNNPRRRFRDHLQKAPLKRTYRDKWIFSLQQKNLVPSLEIIDEVFRAEWGFWEQEYIRVWKMLGVPLTNLTSGGEGGSNPSLETRIKMRAAKLGRKLSLETREKMSAAQVGKKVSLETRAKLSAANRGNKNFLGKKLSFEHRAKIGAANIGKKRSLELRERMSVARRGIKHSPEHRAKIIAANTGKKRSLEARAKMSNAQRGRKHSPETRARLSAAGILAWAARKKSGLNYP